MVIKDGKYIVLKGSRISNDETPSFKNRKEFDEIKKRRVNAKFDSQGLLENDEIFTSPSSAAKFVSGASENGKITWKDDEDITLGTYLDKA